MTTVAAVQTALDAFNTDLTDTRTNYDECLNTIWQLFAATLVVFMHSGFSMLESGCVRHKNAQSILTKNLIVITVGFLCWYVFGYPFAFGTLEDPNKFSGFTNFLMIDLWSDKANFRFWFFQGTFCATGATIVSGAMAERTQIRGFTIYTILMTSFIYPVVAYWGWSGNGWLNYPEGEGTTSSVGPAFIDFAGSGIVHMVGGFAALVGSAIVGARKGRWDADADFDGHSVPFCVMGTFFLWFGWYGFNCGSSGSISDEATANLVGIVAVNTTLAPCVAGLVVFALRAKVMPPKALDVGGFCNGILAGLVAITSGCAVVKHWEAMLIGFIGGLLYCGASFGLKAAKIDDVVDAFPVHGVCGIWGVLAAGLFGDPDHGIGGNGLFYGGDQFRTQVMAVIVIGVWSAGLTAIILFPLKLGGLLRSSDEFQDIGADNHHHTPAKAYNL
mmetsp:Transcript_89709/g.187374  ORF Transcript_89709/g.187374 Transcript_89709/m.187374 type:complete len:444 (-) Transcript_89709:308-1639(-)|eukprot:CAMPEP_0206429214 /NCGR_PEP_ID=MMETSP0324_2-20121206/6108_1 /ASSEMBLY_ACC=CAM_ASM_000836 /TAXON_ID=2866 /ORGANISM="Crypthecodinium cohnii, Strain Seligo" /LENGTH=443 /DNA_ID=CAMNT_0053894853 /DNA_START=184 /DNA_END=1515 /DNA_ORIENTATION=-